MDFSPKQLEYFENADKRWNIKYGATRSGKTYMDYFVIAKRVLAVKGLPGLNVILGNTKGTLQRNIIEPMQAIYGQSLISDIKTDNTSIMFGEKVYCLGADKINHVDKLRGSSIKYCYGDEIVTWHPDVFSMLKSRLDKPYSKFDGACNPDSPTHWFKQFLDSKADIYQQHYTIDDNPFLDPNFIKNLKQEYEGTVYYGRYIQGLWQLAEGLIYPMFSNEKHVVETIDRDYEEYQISMDYGIANPTAMALWGLLDGIWYAVKEYRHSGRETGQQKTDDEYYIELEKLAGAHKIRRVIVDPSALSFIVLLKRKGKFSVKGADNTVLDGIRQTATALNMGFIKINDCCVELIKEFGLYMWDEKSTEDKPIKDFDHMMDLTRYFVKTNKIGVPKRKSLLD